MWVRGLKPLPLLGNRFASMSHPMWVRGLKLAPQHSVKRLRQSHPMWVRGLKRSRFSRFALRSRRTLCGCVD